MRLVRLTEEEKRILTCPEKEMLVFEMIKGMSMGELISFDCYVPKDLIHYNEIQGYWLQTEKGLIEGRLHHKPNDLELIEDAEKNHNFERFHVWYCLIHPDLVKRED